MSEFRLIPLSQGQSAKVDLDDYEFLRQWKWFAWWEANTKSFYAVRNDRSDGKHTTVRMHRVLLGLGNGDRLKADHTNHDTLDNCRSNLRIATNTQNCCNQKKPRNNSSGFKGVTFHKRTALFHARIGISWGRKHLGCFRTAEEAAEAYDAAAKHIYKEFALPNSGG